MELNKPSIDETLPVRRHAIARGAAVLAVGLSAAISGCAPDREPAGPYASEEYHDVPKATEEILHRFDSCNATVDFDITADYPSSMDPGKPVLPVRVVLELGRNVNAISYLSHFENKDDLEWKHIFSPTIQSPDTLKREPILMPSPSDPEYADPVTQYSFQKRDELAVPETTGNVAIPITAFLPLAGDGLTMSLEVRNSVYPLDQATQSNTLSCGTAIVDSEGRWTVAPAN